MPRGKNCLFRWSIGFQDTIKLSDYATNEQYLDMVYLAKLSICSFQKWFPGAEFVLLYNGQHFEAFQEFFHNQRLKLTLPVTIIDQHNPSVYPEKFTNPYEFAPQGVWYKWIPFRFDVTKTEICIDTDIICVNEPGSWFRWLDGSEPILVAPERIENIVVNTCGDFYKHPVLKGKKSVNCGVVGQKEGYDFSSQFFDICKEVKLGSTHDSMFITEQGAINVWVYSMELDGFSHSVLDFEKNTWMRDFIYFMKQGVKVETIHAVSWHKKIAVALHEALENKIINGVDDSEFLQDIMVKARNFDEFAKHIIARQFTEDSLNRELIYA